LITHSSLISFSDTEIRFKQNNVGLIALLQPKSTSKSHHHNQVFLWVANAHLFWNPAYPDVKLFQSWYYLKQIKYYQSYFLKKLAMFKHQSSSKQIPSSWHQNAIPSFHTMICGDFNSTPDSWVYQLFSKSSLSTESIQNPEILAKYKNVIHVTTDFPFLRSAYDNLNDPLTNVQEHFQGCLDYIWYDPESLQLESILENPVTSQELKESVFKYTALPNPFYPSDHLPIMAEFSLKTTTK
jgi:CCR4-NOT transcription complex subunit 6